MKRGDASSRLLANRLRRVRTRRRREGSSFYLRLTKLMPSGNQLLRSVCVMTQHLSPAAGRGDNGFPRPRTAGNSALTADPVGHLGVRPGESDPARMLAGVLLLTVAMMIMALVLAWWLV
jgi:hypothetical protein